MADDTNAVLLPPKKQKKRAKGSKRRSREEPPPPEMSKSKQRKVKEMEVERQRKLLHRKSIMMARDEAVDTNVVLLPPKKKKKRAKGSKRRSWKDPLPSKKRKLKQMEAEKERKLLYHKSIMLLDKYKIRDVLHFVLHSSGTIGQTETKREKRRRALQLFKLGLEVHEGESPFHKCKKRRKKASMEEEATVNLSFEESDPMIVSSGSKLHEEILVVTDDCNNDLISIEDQLEPMSEEGLEGSDYSILPSTSVADEEAVDSLGFGCENHVNIMAESQKNVIERPIVVNVSRPNEVEEARKDLPIVVMEQEIMEAIKELSVILICVETGCAKTTQVPQSDFLLKKYSVIILDEAHERSLNTDILIGVLSWIVKLRQALSVEQQEKVRAGVKINPENQISQLKLILMSPTLCVEDFVSNAKLFLDAPPVIQVPTREYPVTIHFSKNTKEDYLDQSYRKVMSIHKRRASLHKSSLIKAATV